MKKRKTTIPSNPYSTYRCPHCAEDRNGYENHHCAPMRDCETCGRKTVRAPETECVRCRDGN